MDSESKVFPTLPKRVIAALAEKFDKSSMTIYRWVKGRDVVLTTDLAKEVFAKYGLAWNNGDVEELEPPAEVPQK